MSDSFDDDILLAEDSELQQIKTPPHSLEAEQSLLGALMVDNALWDSVSESLLPDDFYRNEHRQIYRAMISLADANSPLDVITLGESLEKEKLLESVGGMNYLMTLAENTPSISNLVAYAKIVQERSILRQLIKVAGDISGLAFDPSGQEVASIIDQAERAVFKIAEDRPHQGGLEHVNPLADKALARIEELAKQNSDIVGISSGFSPRHKFQPITLEVISCT